MHCNIAITKKYIFANLENWLIKLKGINEIHEYLVVLI